MPCLESCISQCLVNFLTRSRNQRQCLPKPYSFQQVIPVNVHTCKIILRNNTIVHPLSPCQVQSLTLEQKLPWARPRHCSYMTHSRRHPAYDCFICKALGRLHSPPAHLCWRWGQRGDRRIALAPKTSRVFVTQVLLWPDGCSIDKVLSPRSIPAYSCTVNWLSSLKCSTNPLP